MPKKEESIIMRQRREAARGKSDKSPATTKSKGKENSSTASSRPLSANARAKATRNRIVNSIPKKNKITRGVVRVVAGTTFLLWRGTKKTTLVGARVAGRGGRALVSKAQKDLKKRKWAPGELTGRAFKSSFRCCDATFNNAHDLNSHFLSIHANEERTAIRTGGAKLVTANTRRNLGQVKVILPPGHTKRVPSGRHRPPRSSGPGRISRFVHVHKEKMIQIGTQAMSDNGPARNIAQAAQAWGEEVPHSVEDVRNSSLAMERALAALQDALDSHARILVREGERYPNIHPEAVTMPFAQAREGLDMAQRGLTRHVALFDLLYAPYFNSENIVAPANLKGMAGRR